MEKTPPRVADSLSLYRIDDKIRVHRRSAHIGRKFLIEEDLYGEADEVGGGGYRAV